MRSKKREKYFFLKNIYHKNIHANWKLIPIGLLLHSVLWKLASVFKIMIINFLEISKKQIFRKRWRHKWSHDLIFYKNMHRILWWKVIVWRLLHCWLYRYYKKELRWKESDAPQLLPLWRKVLVIDLWVKKILYIYKYIYIYIYIYI